MATFMYKYQNNDLPKIFKGMFNINQISHNYPTRQTDNYCVSIRHTEAMKQIMKMTVGVQGAAIWNRMPTSIRSSCSLNVFKYAMKKHIHTNS